MQKTTKDKIYYGSLVGFLFACSLLFSCAGKHLGKNNSGEYKNGMVVSASEIASQVGVDVLKKDNLQSARLAGFGNTDLAVELFVDERYYGKISPVLEEFRMSL